MTPYQQGKDAFRDYFNAQFTTFLVNPYDDGTDDSASFDRGWDDADNAMEKQMIQDGMN
jgi:hypothetical protein